MLRAIVATVAAAMALGLMPIGQAFAAESKGLYGKGTGTEVVPHNKGTMSGEITTEDTDLEALKTKHKAALDSVSAIAKEHKGEAKDLNGEEEAATNQIEEMKISSYQKQRTGDDGKPLFKDGKPVTETVHRAQSSFQVTLSPLKGKLNDGGKQMTLANVFDNAAKKLESHGETVRFNITPGVDGAALKAGAAIAEQRAQTNAEEQILARAKQAGVKPGRYLDIRSLSPSLGGGHSEAPMRAMAAGRSLEKSGAADVSVTQTGGMVIRREVEVVREIDQAKDLFRRRHRPAV